MTPSSFTSSQSKLDRNNVRDNRRNRRITKRIRHRVRNHNNIDSTRENSNVLLINEMLTGIQPFY